MPELKGIMFNHVDDLHGTLVKNTYHVICRELDGLKQTEGWFIYMEGKIRMDDIARKIHDSRSHGNR